jgi:hypothetical protein
MTVPLVHDPSGRHDRRRILPTIRSVDIWLEESIASTRWLPTRVR